MTDQVSSGPVAGVPGTGAPSAHQSAHGRPVSWVSVSVIMVAFLAGGIALVAGPVWWLFWVSLAVAVVGGLIGLATHIMDDWY
jgi:hypothetical protein